MCKKVSSLERTVSNQLISLASREPIWNYLIVRPLTVSNQLISLASRE